MLNQIELGTRYHSGSILQIEVPPANQYVYNDEHLTFSV